MDQDFNRAIKILNTSEVGETRERCGPTDNHHWFCVKRGELPIPVSPGQIIYCCEFCRPDMEEIIPVAKISQPEWDHTIRKVVYESIPLSCYGCGYIRDDGGCSLYRGCDSKLKREAMAFEKCRYGKHLVWGEEIIQGPVLTYKHLLRAAEWISDAVDFSQFDGIIAVSGSGEILGQMVSRMTGCQIASINHVSSGKWVIIDDLVSTGRTIKGVIGGLVERGVRRRDLLPAIGFVYQSYQWSGYPAVFWARSMTGLAEWRLLKRGVMEKGLWPYELLKKKKIHENSGRIIAYSPKEEPGNDGMIEIVAWNGALHDLENLCEKYRLQYIVSSDFSGEASSRIPLIRFPSRINLL